MISLESLRGLYRSSPSPSDREPDGEPEGLVAVVTCMDHRLRPERSLGIPSGRAYVVRNAGGRVTDDALRSLVLAWSQLGASEMVVIQHTSCGMASVTDQQVRDHIEEQLGVDASTVNFYPITDLRSSVRADVRRVRDSPFIPGEIPVSGFICDTDTGQLDVVDADPLSRIPSGLTAPAGVAGRNPAPG